MTAHDIGLQLDDLSDWELPPPSAGDMRPVRVFDSAEAALDFLRAQRAVKIGGDPSPSCPKLGQPSRAAHYQQLHR
jgi:hypothetical protein